MPTYVAFLRAVNVGGRNPVPMKELTRRCERIGFTGVRTFLQSGNVAFEAPRAGPPALAKQVQALLKTWLGSEIDVVVRSLAELEQRVADEPFARRRPGPEDKLYVAFLAGRPKAEPKLPLSFEKEGLEAFALAGQDVFLIARRVNGRFGFPNEFIERAYGLPATTRNLEHGAEDRRGLRRLSAPEAAENAPLPLPGRRRSSSSPTVPLPCPRPISLISTSIRSTACSTGPTASPT
jgi:uncharacterized protein (DUF1697 family)